MEKDKIRELLSYNLKRIRKEKKLSQLKLATEAGIAFTFISNIESGDRWISSETLLNLCNVLEVEPYQFFLPKGFVLPENQNIYSYSEAIFHAINEVNVKYNVKPVVSKKEK